MLAMMEIMICPQELLAVNHINVQTILDPKCAYFKPKYMLAHITITLDTKNTKDKNITAPKNSLLIPQ